MLRENYQRSASNRRLLNMNRRRFLKVRADQSIVCSILQWLIEDCRIIETRSAFDRKYFVVNRVGSWSATRTSHCSEARNTHFHRARVTLNLISSALAEFSRSTLSHNGNEGFVV